MDCSTHPVQCFSRLVLAAGGSGGLAAVQGHREVLGAMAKCFMLTTLSDMAKDASAMAAQCFLCNTASAQHLLQEEQEARRQRKVTEKIEPGVMAKHFMRPEDEAIRAQDMPERQQLATIRLQTTPDWRECAE